MTKKKSSHNLVWMDLEMSGLDPEKDVILEIATIVTDLNLNILAEGPVIAIRQPENVFESMDEWNTKHHNQSGLVDRCRRSQYSLKDAEQETLRFIKPFTEKTPLWKLHHAGQALFVQVHARYFRMAVLQKYRREFHQGTVLPLVPEH